MASSHPNRGRHAFHPALDGWPKRRIFDNLSSFIHKMCPSHLILSLIIALESGIEPHFSYSLLFEIRSVSRLPRIIHRIFLQKTSSRSSSAFRSGHTSEPYLTIVITVASCILILVCRLIFLFFQIFLTVKKHTSFDYSAFNIITAPTVFTTNTTKISEVFHLINLFLTQRHLFIFTYSQSQ